MDEIAVITDSDGVLVIDSKRAFEMHRLGILKYLGPKRIRNVIEHHFEPATPA